MSIIPLIYILIIFLSFYSNFSDNERICYIDMTNLIFCYESNNKNFLIDEINIDTNFYGNNSINKNFIY